MARVESGGAPDGRAGGDPDLSVEVVPAGAGRPVLEGRLLLKLGADRTASAFSLFHGVTPPGLGPPLHAHEREDEVFYVLDGSYEMLIGGDVVPAPQGSCFFLPRLRPHTFRNLGRRAGRLLELVAPGGIERYFDAVAHLGAEANDLDARHAVGLPFGIHFPGEPGEVLPAADGSVVEDWLAILPGDGTALASKGVPATEMLAEAATNGICSLLEVTLAADDAWCVEGLPETWALVTVLEGELDIRDERGGSQARASRHDLVVVPPGASPRAGTTNGHTRLLVCSARATRPGKRHHGLRSATSR